MKNTTKQIVRHFNHKHSRLLQQLIIEDKLKPEPPTTATSTQSSNISAHLSQTLEATANNCFSTNQVLVIIAVTCFLNFAFIILIMMCVQILGATAKEQEISEEDALLNEDREELFGEDGRLNNFYLDVEYKYEYGIKICLNNPGEKSVPGSYMIITTDGFSSWESSRLCTPSLPDNVFGRKLAEAKRALRNKKLKLIQRHSLPTSRTYHFEPVSSFTNDSDSDVDTQKYNHRELKYSWDNFGNDNYTMIDFDRKHSKRCHNLT